MQRVLDPRDPAVAAQYPARQRAWDDAQYLATHGSEAYGLATEESDLDLKGASIPVRDSLLGYHLPYVPDLIARKLAGGERAALDGADLQLHRAEFERLLAALEQARDTTHLPEMPSARPALHDLLLRVRLAGTSGV